MSYESKKYRNAVREVAMREEFMDDGTGEAWTWQAGEAVNFHFGHNGRTWMVEGYIPARPNQFRAAVEAIKAMGIDSFEADEWVVGR